MDGRRFGVGLVVGLAFALLIVGVSGFVSSVVSPLSGGLTKSGSELTPAASTTNTLTSSVTTPVYGSSITSRSQNTSILLTNLNSITTAATNAQGYGPANEFSSSLASINQLPTASRALLLAPILAAFLLGALLYRTSVRSRVSSEEE